MFVWIVSMASVASFSLVCRIHLRLGLKRRLTSRFIRNLKVEEICIPLLAFSNKKQQPGQLFYDLKTISPRFVLISWASCWETHSLFLWSFHPSKTSHLCLRTSQLYLQCITLKMLRKSYFLQTSHLTLGVLTQCRKNFRFPRDLQILKVLVISWKFRERLTEFGSNEFQILTKWLWRRLWCRRT